MIEEKNKTPAPAPAPSNEEELKRIQELEGTNQNLTLLLNNAEKKYAQLSSMNVELQKKINSLEQLQLQQQQQQQDQMYNW